MKRGRTYEWLPLWRQKWLMGSTRWELEPAQRAVFVDFLCLAGGDDGYIRANPETPYPLPYLAGTLHVSLDVLTSTIERCIEVGKLKRDDRGCLFVCSWAEYQLNPRHKKRLLAETERETNTETDTEKGTQNCDAMSQNYDTKKISPRKPEYKPSQIGNTTRDLEEGVRRAHEKNKKAFPKLLEEGHE